MNITTTTKKFRLTDDLRQRIDRKLQKLERYFRHDAEAAVRLYTQKNHEIAEVTVVSNGLHFRAEARSDDMFGSLEEAVDNLERQVRKHKSRLKDTLQKGAFEPGDAAVPEEEVFELVRQKRFVLKPMDMEEAILQMNLLGHNFFVYRNSEEEKVCVVYQRHGGGYGQIVVE